MKQSVRKAINMLGYEISRRQPETIQKGFNSRYLATLCSPGTVIDVGIGNGTYPLYEAYPKAHFILIEPLQECEAVLAEISSKYSCTAYVKAVGRSEGQLDITVDLNDPEKSSFGTRSRLTSRPHTLARRSVEVTTLDAILRDNPAMARPILLKLDTEGHELETLNGATELLKVTDVVISEVSVARRFEDGYRFEDILIFMKDHGFRFVDILAMAHAPGEISPRHMDVLFMNGMAAEH